MPAINATRSTAIHLHSMTSFSRTSEPGNDPTYSSAYLTSSIVSSTAIPTSSPILSSNDSRSMLTWDAPRVAGTLLAILAILIGLPSALLAVRKLRNRRGANMSNNSRETNIVEDPSSEMGGNSVVEGIHGAGIDPSHTLSTEPSIDLALPLGDKLDEHGSSTRPDTRFPPVRDDGYEMGSMIGSPSTASSLRGVVAAKTPGV